MNLLNTHANINRAPISHPANAAKVVVFKPKTKVEVSQPEIREAA